MGVSEGLNKTIRARREARKTGSAKLTYKTKSGKKEQPQLLMIKENILQLLKLNNQLNK